MPPNTMGACLKVRRMRLAYTTAAWFGRSAADAPDVDGKIFFLANGKRPRLGEFRKIKITDCIDCDLMGEIVG